MTLLGFGEVMLEFREASDGKFDASCAGDVFNTLATAQKYGLKTIFFSSLGEDFFLKQLKNHLLKFSVDISDCALKKTNNGIYFVRLKEDGQREFQFYRKDSAASQTTLSDVKNLKSYDAIYTSAIASGISKNCSQVVEHLLKQYSIENKKTFYDLNYRKALWSLDDAVSSFKNISKYIDTLFLSEDELDLVFKILEKECTPQEAINKLTAFGPNTVILRMGAKGSIAFDKKSNKTHVTETKQVNAVDTTGAGDVFAGAYVASMTKNSDLEASLRTANNAALQKVQKLGTLNFLLE